MPATWTRSDGQTYCLGCSRARAADAAMDFAPETASPDDRIRLRRNALIEFELARTPTAPDRVVANACRTSSKAVSTVRGEMGLCSPVLEPALPPAG